MISGLLQKLSCLDFLIMAIYVILGEVGGRKGVGKGDINIF